MGWRWIGDKPLAEPLLITWFTDIYAALGGDELTYQVSHLYIKFPPLENNQVGLKSKEDQQQQWCSYLKDKMNFKKITSKEMTALYYQYYQKEYQIAHQCAMWDILTLYVLNWSEGRIWICILLHSFSLKQQCRMYEFKAKRRGQRNVDIQCIFHVFSKQLRLSRFDIS